MDIESYVLGTGYTNQEIEKIKSDLNTTDNIIEGVNNKFMTPTEKTKLANITSPFLFKGQINISADFPLTTDVQAGWTYEIKSDVTDNDATKTNTGLSFKAGDTIAWDSSTFIAFENFKGDMTKALYDSNNDGKVDKSETADNSLKFNGQDPSYYATANDLTSKLDKIAIPIADELVTVNADGTVKGSGQKIVDIKKGSAIGLDTTNFNKNLDSTITDTQKLADKVDDLTIIATYSHTEPTLQAWNGIPANTTLTGKSIEEILYMALNPYTPPTISLSSSVACGIKEYGTSISSVDLSATTVKKSNDIIDIQILRNGTIIDDITTPTATGSTVIYTDTTVINDTVTYTAKVSDGTQIITSNPIQYKFVNPTFIGALVTDVPTSSDILGLNRLIQAKGNISYDFTLTNSRFVLAYDSTWGDLTSILDVNLFQILSDFTKTVVPITIGGNSVNYNVYIFNNITSQSGFNIQFKF